MTQEQDIVERLGRWSVGVIPSLAEDIAEAVQTIAALRAERDEAKEANRKLHRRVQQAEAPAISVKDYKQMLWNVFSDLAFQPERVDETVEAYKASGGVNLKYHRDTAKHQIMLREAAEARVKELEAVVRSLQQELKRSAEAGMRVMDQRTTAIRERDEARKALEQIREEDWSEYQTKSGPFKVPGKGATIAITALDDLRRARVASSNREGGE